MPAKKKGKKKAKGSSKGEKGGEEGGGKPEPTGKEQELRRELEVLTEKLSNLKREVEELYLFRGPRFSCYKSPFV